MTFLRNYKHDSTKTVHSNHLIVHYKEGRFNMEISTAVL